MTGKDEHLMWCKTRAMAYLTEGSDPMQGWLTFSADMAKNKETMKHRGLSDGTLAIGSEGMNTAGEVLAFIEGFN